MLVKATHRIKPERIDFGHLCWHKEYKEQDSFHDGAFWTTEIYIVVLILDGSGKYEIEEISEWSLGPGDLIVLFPNVSARILPDDGTKLDFLLFGFYGPVFEIWKQSKLLDLDRAVLSLGEPKRWRARLLDVVVSDDDTTPERDVMEVCRLQQFLSDARRQAMLDSENHNDKEWRELVKSSIQPKRHDEIDLNAIANQCGMEYEAFRKRFKRVFGISPRSYCNRLIAESACRLFENEKLTNSKVAEELGFVDEFYFSRFFKKMVGMTPSNFRKYVS